MKKSVIDHLCFSPGLNSFRIVSCRRKTSKNKQVKNGEEEEQAQAAAEAPGHRAFGHPVQLPVLQPREVLRGEAGQGAQHRSCQLHRLHGGLPDLHQLPDRGHRRVQRLDRRLRTGQLKVQLIGERFKKGKNILAKSFSDYDHQSLILFWVLDFELDWC